MFANSHGIFDFEQELVSKYNTIRSFPLGFKYIKLFCLTFNFMVFYNIFIILTILPLVDPLLKS